MCVWCKQYGQGHKRWYFNPANYARRLYKIRKEEAEATGAEANPQAAGGMALVGRDYLEAQERGDIATVTKIKQDAEQRAWQVHFGQIITLEEVQEICDIMYPIGLMTCACRRSMRGLPDNENFTCIGMGPGMYKWERWPDTYRGGVSFVSPNEAKEMFKSLNRRGLVHMIATFGTPYLGGICNCDYPDCSFIRTTTDLNVRVAWKGHYVAQVDPELCNGCGLCAKRCQFRALNFSASSYKAFINPVDCFGCGLCKTVCPIDGAVNLIERESLPALKDVW